MVVSLNHKKKSSVLWVGCLEVVEKHPIEIQPQFLCMTQRFQASKQSKEFPGLPLTGWHELLGARLVWQWEHLEENIGIYRILLLTALLELHLATVRLCSGWCGALRANQSARPQRLRAIACKVGPGVIGRSGKSRQHAYMCEGAVEQVSCMVLRELCSWKTGTIGERQEAC